MVGDERARQQRAGALLAAVGVGMLAVLLVGGVVCTALSMAGGLVTNFKLGYWLGASPKRIVWLALVGSLISAIFVLCTGIAGRVG